MEKQIIRFNFYLGWNNQTHKREIKKAFKILDDNKVLGYSKTDVLGMWDKTRENSFIISVLSTTENPLSDDNAIKIKYLLEKDLKQFLVILTKDCLTELS